MCGQNQPQQTAEGHGRSKPDQSRQASWTKPGNSTGKQDQPKSLGRSEPDRSRHNVAHTHTYTHIHQTMHTRILILMPAWSRKSRFSRPWTTMYRRQQACTGRGKTRSYEILRLTAIRDPCIKANVSMNTQGANAVSGGRGSGSRHNGHNAEHCLILLWRPSAW